MRCSDLRGEVRRYQLRTSAPWRAALERLRAASTVLAGLDTPDPTTRRGRQQLEQRACLLASLAWSSAPERTRARFREHLAPEAGDVEGWLAAGIVDAVAQRQPGRLDETPEGLAYRQGHAAATIALLSSVPMFDDPPPDRGERQPMNDRPQQPTALVSIDDAAREHGLDPQAMQQFLLSGDLSSVPPMARASLYVALCRYIGVDPIERPFLIFSDKGRTVLYAARSCTSALCRSRGISRELLGVEIKTIGGHEMAVARARATIDETGRHDEATGAVPMLQWDKGANRWREPSPDEVANTVMKAETKAKRRAVLDLVGLGIPDESEVATIRGARTGSLDLSTGEIVIEAGEPKRERPKPEATVESIRAAAARVVSLSVEPTTVEDVIAWACGKVNVPGVDDYKAPEQLAAVERYLMQAADKMAARPKVSKPAPAPSSPDHAGALARVMRLVDDLARLRDWDVEQVLADELRSGAKLATMAVDELETLAQRLDHQVAVEREDAP